MTMKICFCDRRMLEAGTDPGKLSKKHTSKERSCLCKGSPRTGFSVAVLQPSPVKVKLHTSETSALYSAINLSQEIWKDWKRLKCKPDHF